MKYKGGCVGCSYHWKNEDEDYPSCHWEARCPGDIPPCEEDDEGDDIDACCRDSLGNNWW